MRKLCIGEKRSVLCNNPFLVPLLDTEQGTEAEGRSTHKQVSFGAGKLYQCSEREKRQQIHQLQRQQADATA